MCRSIQALLILIFGAPLLSGCYGFGFQQCLPAYTYCQPGNQPHPPGPSPFAMDHGRPAPAGAYGHCQQIGYTTCVTDPCACVPAAPVGCEAPVEVGCEAPIEVGCEAPCVDTCDGCVGSGTKPKKMCPLRGLFGCLGDKKKPKTCHCQPAVCPPSYVDAPDSVEWTTETYVETPPVTADKDLVPAEPAPIPPVAEDPPAVLVPPVDTPIEPVTTVTPDAEPEGEPVNGTNYFVPTIDPPALIEPISWEVPVRTQAPDWRPRQ